MDFGISVKFFFTVILPSIIVVLGSILIERLISSKISNFSEEKKLPTSHAHTLKFVLRWIIVIVDILIVSSLFGVAIGRLWMIISTIAAMIIIGFVAVWSLLANVLAAIVIMASKPFRIGDKITILPEDLTGEAIETTLFFTRIETEEGDIISIPNTQIMQKFIKVIQEESEVES